MTNTIVPSIHCLSNKLIATFERLCSETRPCYGVEEDMKKLKVMLLNIQAVLQDAEERSVRDESVYLWLMKLKDVVFVLDDVFDEYEYDLLQHQVMMKNEKVDDFISSSQKKLRSVVCTVDDDDDDDDARNENEYELSPYAVKDAKRKREFDNEDSSNSKSLAAKMLGECLSDETGKKKLLDILLSNFWGHEIDKQHYHQLCFSAINHCPCN